MATHINDLASSVIVKSILAPQVIDEADPEGASADMGNGDGPCFAIQVIGEAEGDPQLTGRIEESHDQSTWVAISGAAFAATATAGLEVIRFQRSRRYLRWAAEYEPDEGDSIAASAIIQQGKKIA